MNACADLALVLNAHLPYIRHPEHGDPHEERWLHEAILESYLPLLDLFLRLAEEGVPYRLTLSLSPTLLEMLADPLHRGRFERYLDSRLELVGLEHARTRSDPELRPIVEMYRDRFTRMRTLFIETCRRDLTRAFGQLARAGFLELLTTAATHAYLPLLRPDGGARQVQIRVGLDTFEERLGWRPRGFWLPECGYPSSLDQTLRAEGVAWFLVDTPSLLCARPRPLAGPYAPTRCPSGVACFARDLESTLEIWGAQGGFPSHPDYREFYRDIGWDLPLEHVRPFIHESGQRVNTGLKYHRITGPTDHKEPYRPDLGAAMAALHAGSYLRHRAATAAWLADRMKARPVLVTALDADLLGHRWFEGPWWLEHLLRKVHEAPQGLELTTLSDALDRAGELQTVSPSEGSWGEGGFHARWLNPDNDWIHLHLARAGRRLREARDQADLSQEPIRRALNQAGRELLLSQASDWPSLLSSGTHPDYARRRARRHLVDLHRLLEQIREGAPDLPWLGEIERRAPIFKSLDVQGWSCEPGRR